MEHLGIKVDIKNIPELDKNYIPLHKFNAAFLEGAKKPFCMAAVPYKRAFLVGAVYFTSSMRAVSAASPRRMPVRMMRV